MTRAITIGVVGLMLSISAAWAGDFNPEGDFVTRASSANLVAIAESRLARDRADVPQVKDFANRLVADHETAQTELQNAANGSGATVPTTLDPADQARVTALQDKSGADFDKAYIADQVEVHSNALTLYGDYMLLGDHEKLKALAIKMIPITGTQFKDAQALSRN